MKLCIFIIGSEFILTVGRISSSQNFDFKMKVVRVYSERHLCLHRTLLSDCSAFLFSIFFCFPTLNDTALDHDSDIIHSQLISINISVYEFS